MKRMRMMLTAMLVLAALLAGCGREKAEVPETTQSGGPVAVNSVDGMLEAIAPGAEITLEPGTYDLCDAKDYGITDCGYYGWEEADDGFQLVIKGVDGLAIRGSGRDNTSIVIQPRYSNVLEFQNCDDIVLEDFTAGHTEGADCVGGVVSVRGCRGVQIARLGLFGCGTVGLSTELCMDVAIRDSEIYDCSYSALQSFDTENLLVENCVLRDLGDVQYGGGIVFSLHDSRGIAITGCEIANNSLSYMFSCYPVKNVQIRNCTFRDNRVDSLMFSLSSQGGLVMDGCTFENNRIRGWLESEGDTILDGVGKSWTNDMLKRAYEPSVEIVPLEDRVQVTVDNVDDLLASIAPNTEILLKDGTYDFSTARGYGVESTDYYCWVEEYDGPNLLITDVTNLIIRSESGNRDKCILSAVPRYANVLTFRRCSYIIVADVTAGHTVEPGYCMGGVLNFTDCDNLVVENSALYGCGILGVQADLCSNITVKDCEIYECSQGGIQMSDVAGIQIEGCTFRDLEGQSIYLYACRDAMVDGAAVEGYYSSNDYVYSEYSG